MVVVYHWRSELSWCFWIDSYFSGDLKQDDRGGRRRHFFTGREESVGKVQNTATRKREEDLQTGETRQQHIWSLFLQLGTKLAKVAVSLSRWVTRVFFCFSAVNWRLEESWRNRRLSGQRRRPLCCCCIEKLWRSSVRDKSAEMCSRGSRRRWGCQAQCLFAIKWLGRFSAV